VPPLPCHHFCATPSVPRLPCHAFRATPSVPLFGLYNRVMGAKAPGPLEEYLATSYSPDREYVDGDIAERYLGEREHSTLQAELTTFFNVRRRELNLRVLPEQRVQVSPARFRVPDVCLVAGNPKDPVVLAPPLLCIEILSKDDRMIDVQEKIDDYLRFGVPVVWVF